MLGFFPPLKGIGIVVICVYGIPNVTLYFAGFIPNDFTDLNITTNVVKDVEDREKVWKKREGELNWR